MIRYIATLLFLAETAFAQSVETDGQATGSITESIAGALNLEQGSYDWIQQAHSGDKEKVISILEQNGYIVGPDANWLAAADRFTVLSRAAAPGKIVFLVIPDTADAKPVTYAPLDLGISGFDQYAASTASYTSQGIASKILDATKKSISAVCGIGAEPESVTGTASAAGIIEIEATWSGSSICDAVQ
jgi:hypothetical protein